VALGLPVGHRIAEDAGHVNRAANLGQLLVQSAPKSPLARQFEELAADLGGGNVQRKWWQFLRSN
jgi:Flp pilus assembly CpaE family ATPase